MARRTGWEDTTISLGAAEGAQGSQQLMTSFEADERMGMTISRWIAELGIYSNSIAGAYGVARVSIGITMLDADAAAAGAFPDPNASTDEPPRGWVWRTHCLASQNGVGTPIVVRCLFDIRSMRKFDSAVAYIIVNNESLVGTSFTISVAGILRCLILLP